MADMGKVESCKGQESLKGQEDRPARPSRVQTVVRFAGVLVLGAAIGAIVMFVADKPTSSNNADGPNVTAAFQRISDEHSGEMTVDLPNGTVALGWRMVCERGARPPVHMDCLFEQIGCVRFMDFDANCELDGTRIPFILDKNFSVILYDPAGTDDPDQELNSEHRNTTAVNASAEGYYDDVYDEGTNSTGNSTLEEDEDEDEEDDIEVDTNSTSSQEGNATTAEYDSRYIDLIRVIVAKYTREARLVQNSTGFVIKRIPVEVDESSGAASFTDDTDNVTFRITEVGLEELRHRRQRRAAPRTEDPPSEFVPPPNSPDQSGTFGTATSGNETRTRRQADPVITVSSGIGAALKNAWQGGPFVQVPRVVSARWGQEWYLPNVDASITQLEVMMPSLPDIRVVGFVPALGSSNDYVVRLGVDMTQGGQCTSAIQARARLYFRARGCISFIFFRWCYIDMRVDGRAEINIAPVVEIDLVARPRGSDLDYSFRLHSVNMFSNLRMPSLAVNSNIGVAAGFVLSPLFGPVGLLGGWLFDRYIERRLRDFYNDAVRNLPSQLTSAVRQSITNALPRSGTIRGAGAALVAARLLAGHYNGAQFSLLAVDLSDIGNLLSHAPAPFQPNRIPCLGSGLVEVLPDSCVHDYGQSGSGDSLEIYCIHGSMRFCLSRELCPWRSGSAASCASNFALGTCSMGGLWSGSVMARTSCKGSTTYSCNRGSISTSTSTSRLQLQTLDQPGVRICMREIAGQVQCQGSRNSCSGFSSNPFPTIEYQDRTGHDSSRRRRSGWGWRRRRRRRRRVTGSCGMQYQTRGNDMQANKQYRLCFRETTGNSYCQGSRNTCTAFGNSNSWTAPFRDATRHGNLCRYTWRIEEQARSNTPVQKCRVCFQETEGSGQCRGNRNSCSGWSNAPGWNAAFYDQTNHNGACTYRWRLDCVNA